MPDRDSVTFFSPAFVPVRWMIALAALASASALPHAAFAQGGPQFGGAPSGPNSPICQRLVAQLASVDSGAAGGDGQKAEQIRRYEEAQGRQQQELDRVQQQARANGCDSSGFFSLFTGGASERCGPINTRIQQMRQNLDQINSNLGSLRGNSIGGSDRDGQRRSVLLALAQNNCGPQYANAARSGGGNFLENLFGGLNPGGEFGAPSSTFRTVCARSCDGYYFPISFATVPSRFADDERVCKSLCPNAEATLFTYRNPGEDMNQAVSINGQPYSQSPNAFKYRQAFDKACSCRAAGQTWSEALKNIDDRSSVAQGDIIVTDEAAKKMSAPPRTPASAQKKNTDAPAANTTASTPPSTTTTSGDRPIRSVGPTFIPAR